MDTLHTFCINYCQVQIYSMYAPLHPLQRYHWPFSAFCNNWHSTYVKHHVSMHTHTRALARTHVHASTQCYVKLTEQTSDWQREHTTAHSLHVTCGQEHLRHSECVILCLNTYTHTCMDIHGLNTCMHAHTCTHAHGHMHVCTHMHTHGHMHIQTEWLTVTFAIRECPSDFPLRCDTLYKLVRGQSSQYLRILTIQLRRQRVPKVSA